MKLYEFQERAIQDVINAPKNRWIVDFEPGLGKSAVAIHVAIHIARRVADTGRSFRVLICTPAIVRQAWQEQFDLWWPGHPELGIINGGRERKSGSKNYLEVLRTAYLAPVQVVSYALLSDVDASPWDLVVFDESHRLKSPGAIQSKFAKQLVKTNPGAAVLLLTGTLMPDDVKDLWHQLDLVQPGAWGRSSGKYPSFSFCNRYSGKVPNKHSPLGYDFRGGNPNKMGDLRNRLRRISTRVTKAEVAHLLPPFLVKLIKIEETSSFKTVEDWEKNAGGVKEKAILEWVEDATAQASHVCVLTYHKDTAKVYAEQCSRLFGEELEIFLITGELQAERRNQELAKAKDSKRAIVVATMDSVGIGIDMTYCTVACMAELHWKVDVILQALQRFSRLSSKVPSSVDILCLSNSIDEMQARAIKKKLDAINAVNGAGFTDEKIKTSLELVKEPEDKVLAKLTSALESGNFDEEDLYGVA